MNPTARACRTTALAILAFSLAASAAPPPPTPPDLIRNETTGVDRNATYNLGSTGLRGWIYTRPDSHLDALQGRTTTASRQILVTHVGAKSPADGVVRVNDVILGAGGGLFTSDARKCIAAAIQEAEKEENGGVLKLSCWRDGKAMDLELKLRVMGTYSRAAPYNCPKSQRIFDEACAALTREPLANNWHGAISGLALLASGKSEHLPLARELAHKMGPATLDIQNKTNGSTWDLGYQNIFLCEYFLLTGDPAVRHAINEITLSLARGQGMYGTFGHGFAAPVPKDQRPSSIPPYGPVNQAGLGANIGIVLGRKCGVKGPEVDAAIERANRFFGYFVDKGTIPYGEHEPWPYHDNNGKSAMSAVMFGIQPGQSEAARFFAKMSTAGHRSRECGHTGQGFSYLWGALGANIGGPDATAAFFKEASWHFDLVRRCDGSFTYDGAEQYGPGKTDDDTYYGKSGYNGLSPNASYVLTYSLPLKKLLITGRDGAEKNHLDKDEAAVVAASGRFDLDRLRMSPEELVAAFKNWSPIVRGWAAEELAKRPEAKPMIPSLLAMAEGPDAHARQGACQTLGHLKSTDALPAFIRLLRHPDRWLRFKAAKALKEMGTAAKPVLPDMLVALKATAQPLKPIDWADPIQLVHGQLASALFAGPLAASVKESDRKLLYPAVQVVSQNPDGMARANLRGFFENSLTVEDVEALAPTILAAVMTACPADTMFSNEIRMGGFKALTKYHFKEGVMAGVNLAKTQGGHGSENRTGDIMKEIVTYGTAAREAIPGLRELIDQFNTDCKNGLYPAGELNNRRVGAIQDAIRTIETATTQPTLRTVR